MKFFHMSSKTNYTNLKLHRQAQGVVLLVKEFCLSHEKSMVVFIGKINEKFKSASLERVHV